MTLATIALLLANILCVFLARRMAQDRAKPPTLWMWLAAFFGPVPLIILAVIEARLTSLARKPFDLVSCARSLHEPLA